jgi:hypothetical protein
MASRRELSVTAGIMSGFDGNPVPFLFAVWSGDALQGEKPIQNLRMLGTPLLVKIARMGHGELLRIHDPKALNYSRQMIRTRRLPKLTPEIISAILKASMKRTSPLSAVALHHFRGRPTQVSPSITAFVDRQEHLICEIIATWDRYSAESDASHDAWGRELAQTLAIASSSAACMALFASSQMGSLHNIPDDRSARLRRVKERYDPCRRFG